MQRRTTVDVNPNIAGILSLFDPALDWSADLSGDEYESVLKEFLVVNQVGSKDPRKDNSLKGDEVEAIREEWQRVRKNKNSEYRVAKRIISPQKLLGGSNLTPAQSEGEGGDLAIIKEKVISIARLLGDEEEFHKEQAKLEAEERERKKRNLKERLLAGAKNIWGGIQKVAGAVIKPFKSIWSKILNFLQTVILGNILMRILRWGAKEENQKKVKSIFKFLADFWPTILAAYILFGTGFTRFVANFVKSIAWGIGKMAILIPKLLKAIAKLKAGKFLRMIPGKGKLKALTGLFSMGAGAFNGGGLVQGYNEGGMVDGIDGAPGQDGVDGAPGQDGMSLLPEGLPGLGGGGGGTNAITDKAMSKSFGTRTKDIGNLFARPFRDKTEADPRSNFASGFKQGGFVSGPAGADKVPARLTAGEFVMSKGAVQKYGVNTLASMNAAGGGTNRPTAGRYKTGGLVEGFSTYSPELIAEEKKFASYKDRRLVSPQTVLQGAVHDVYDDSGNFKGRTQGEPLRGTPAEIRAAEAEIKKLKNSSIVASKDNGTKVNITPLSKKKPEIIVIEDPNEEVDSSDADIPSGGSREIPNFDATAIRSIDKMQVLGISI